MIKSHQSEETLEEVTGTNSQNQDPSSQIEESTDDVNTVRMIDNEEETVENYFNSKKQIERSYRFIQNSHIKAKNRNPHLFFIFEFISLNVESYTVESVSYTRAREFLLSLLLDNTNLGGI